MQHLLTKQADYLTKQHPNDENIAVITFSGFGTNKVYKTTDGGNSWYSIQGNLPDSPVNDAFIYTEDTNHPNTYFVATDVGVFLTKDDGANWVELPNNLPNTVILHLDYSKTNKMLRAGTHGRGVYEAYIDFSVPVELSSFTAETNVNKVLLRWSTASEVNNHGFEIERKLKNQEWVNIAFVEGNGTTTELKNYSYTDDYSVSPYEGTVLYRLKQVDFDGSFKYSTQLAVDLTFIPSEYYISQNYPNPFNPSTTIKFSIPEASQIKINIYNSIGEAIEKLADGSYEPGNYELKWNAQNYPSGIYFYTFEVNNSHGTQVHREMRKIVYLK
ncbi:MAG: T9SS type A sorting domain-containing protein [Ignavibacteriaceae bacterium]